MLSQVVEINTFIGDILDGSTGRAKSLDGSDKEHYELVIINWLAKNYTYTMLLMLPFFTLASYLAFWKSGYNYLEHFVLNAYLSGQQAIFYMIFAVLSLIIDKADLLVNLTLLVSIGYAFAVFLQFFSKQSRLSVILRSLLAYVLYIILMSSVIILVMAIGKYAYGN